MAITPCALMTIREIVSPFSSATRLHTKPAGTDEDVTKCDISNEPVDDEDDESAAVRAVFAAGNASIPCGTVDGTRTSTANIAGDARETSWKTIDDIYSTGL